MIRAQNAGSETNGIVRYRTFIKWLLIIGLPIYTISQIFARFLERDSPLQIVFFVIVQVMVFGEIMALLVGTSYFIFRVTFQCLAPLSKKSQMFIWLQTIEINTVPFLSRKHHVYRQEPIRRVRSKTKYVLGINFFAFSTLAIIAVQLVVRETDRLGAGNS